MQLNCSTAWLKFDSTSMFYSQIALQDFLFFRHEKTSEPVCWLLVCGIIAGFNTIAGICNLQFGAGLYLLLQCLGCHFYRQGLQMFAFISSNGLFMLFNSQVLFLSNLFEQPLLASIYSLYPQAPSYKFFRHLEKWYLQNTVWNITGLILLEICDNEDIKSGILNLHASCYSVQGFHLSVTTLLNRAPTVKHCVNINVVLIL